MGQPAAGWQGRWACFTERHYDEAVALVSMVATVTLGRRYGGGHRAGLNAAHHALMKVAELLSAESVGAATDSGDLNVSAELDVGVTRHIRRRAAL
jgi:hypothetical protein